MLGDRGRLGYCADGWLFHPEEFEVVLGWFDDYIADLRGPVALERLTLTDRLEGGNTDVAWTNAIVDG